MARASAAIASVVRTLRYSLRGCTVITHRTHDPADVNVTSVLDRAIQTLKRRLAAHPGGQLVAVAPDGRLLGAAYTQRVASCEALLSAQRATEHELHTPSGRVLQLLGMCNELLHCILTHCSRLFWGILCRLFRGQCFCLR